MLDCDYIPYNKSGDHPGVQRGAGQGGDTGLAGEREGGPRQQQQKAPVWWQPLVTLPVHEFTDIIIIGPIIIRSVNLKKLSI